MKLSSEWIQDYLPLGGDSAELRACLDAIGLRVMHGEQTAEGDVFELENLPHRPDLQGHRGVARELAVKLGLDLLEPTRAEPGPEEIPIEDFNVQVKDEDLCFRFSVGILRGTTGGPTPERIRKRLEAVGIPSRDRITDVARFVSLDIAQPLHVFDLRRIEGDRLVVRRALHDEHWEIPDKKTLTLSSEMLVIADEKRPLALAGVVSGESAAVSGDTRDIVLCSGGFAQSSVRRTRKRIGFDENSSPALPYGCDPQLPPGAVSRAAALLSGASGVPLAIRDIYPRPWKPKTIVLRRHRIGDLLGVEIEETFISRILSAQGFQLKSKQPGIWQVKSPSHRGDIERETDLIEEIARFYGVDRIPAATPSRLLSAAPELAEKRRREARLRRILYHQGFDEIATHGFSDPEKEVWFGKEREAVEIRNPIGLQDAVLKTTLLGGILDTLALNLSRGADGVHLFETGRICMPSEEGYRERLTLALAETGRLDRPHWQKRGDSCDFFHLKGTCDVLLEYLGFESLDFEPRDHPYFEPGYALALLVKGKTLGFLGRVGSGICDAYGLERPVWAAEIDLDELLAKQPRGNRTMPPGSTHTSERVMSFSAPAALEYQAVRDSIERLSVPQLEECTLLEWGEADPSGEARLFTLRFRFSQPGKEWLADEVEALVKKILKPLEEGLGIQSKQGGRN